MIGERVHIEIKGRCDNPTIIDGIIVDKYTGLVRKRNEMPSGQGGSISLDMWFNVDYYIIKTEEELHHIECDRINHLSNCILYR